jgi:hypothetical protein
MFGGLFLLLIVAGIVYAVMRLRASRSTVRVPGAGSDALALRRVFQYLLGLAVLVIGALGLTGLIAAAFPGDDPSRAQLARWVAFSVVAVPVWIGLALSARRRLDGDAAERGSSEWILYLNVALAASLAVVMVAGVVTARWAVGLEDFEPFPCAALIVVAGVWALHWWAAMRWSSGRLEIHTALGSVAGTALSGAALWLGAAAGMAWLYAEVFEGAEPVAVGEGLRSAAALAAAGVPVWWWYWFRRLRMGGRTVIWHGYVLLVGVLGSVVSGVVAVSVVVFTALAWVIGDPGTSTAVRHFDIVPLALPGVLVGPLGWWYYRTILRRQREAGRTEVDRVYDYLVAGAGLLTATAGITVLFVGLIEWLLPSGASGTAASAENTPALAVTLLAVGLPLWGLRWAGIQRARSGDPAAEIASPSRRVYLIVLFGLTAVAAVIALIVILVRVLTDVFESEFGSETIDDVRVAIALVVTLAILAGYHWAVHLRDRSLAPEEAPGRRSAIRSLVLVAPVDPGFVARLGSLTGARVRVLRVVGDPTAVGVEEIAALLEAETHERVVVVVADGTARVFPYEER